MSSYLNKLPPPPPPPRAANSVAPASDDPQPAHLAVPTARKGHKSTGSTSSHYNDAPELDSVTRTPSQKRSRATSRAVASLNPSPPPPTASSTSPAPAPLPSTADDAPPVVPTDETILPAFTAPPPPPPEPTLSRRYGPLADSFHHPADVLTFPPISPALPLKLVLLFIPGNPGLVDFYRHFLASLRDSLPGELRNQTKLYAVGHLRHTPGFNEDRGFNPRGLPSLDDQVKDKCTFVEGIVEEDGIGRPDGPKLVVLGHSIGAWIGLQVRLVLSHPSLPRRASRTRLARLPRLTPSPCCRARRCSRPSLSTSRPCTPSSQPSRTWPSRPTVGASRPSSRPGRSAPSSSRPRPSRTSRAPSSRASSAS